VNNIFALAPYSTDTSIVRFSLIGARTPEKQQTSDLQKKKLSEGQRNIEFLTVSRLAWKK
jgi:hypothetical protein